MGWEHTGWARRSTKPWTTVSRLTLVQRAFLVWDFQGGPCVGLSGCWVLGWQPGAKHDLLSDVLSIRTDVQGEQRWHHLDSTPSGRTEGRSGKELSLLRQEASRTV